MCNNIYNSSTGKGNGLITCTYLGDRTFQLVQRTLYEYECVTRIVILHLLNYIIVGNLLEKNPTTLLKGIIFY